MSNFMAVLKTCPKCKEKYMPNYQSAECPHQRLADLMSKEIPIKEQIDGLLSWYGEDCNICGYDETKRKKALAQILSLVIAKIDKIKNPYKTMIIEEAGNILCSEEMCELEVGFEDARDAIKKGLEWG